MTSPEAEITTSRFQVLPEEQRQTNRVIADVLFLGLEDSSEGFTPKELDDVEMDIATVLNTGKTGESVGDVSTEEETILSGKPQK